MNQTINKQPKISFNLMILHNNIFMRSLNFLSNLCANLISNVIYMRPTISCANWVHKWHLVELSVRMSNKDFPVSWFVRNDGEISMIVCVKIHLHIVFKPINVKLLAIQSYFYFWAYNSSHVICSFSEKSNVVFIKFCHFKLW